MSTEAAPASRSGALALAATAVTVILWASAFVAIRRAGTEISAGALTLGRLCVGSAVLGVMTAVRGGRMPGRRDWGLLVLCGVAWFGIYNLALNQAERHVDAGVAAMVVNIGPILIAALAGVVLHEGFPRGLVAGIPVAFAGVAVIGVSASSGARGDVTGIILCVVAAIAYAVGVVSQKPVLRRLPALNVTWLACTIGAVASLPFLPVLISDASHASATSLVMVIYLGAFPTAVAFTTWAFALSRTTAGRMGATTYLVPPLAILMGWAFLGEQPAAIALLGGALCLGGVWITRRKTRPQAPKAVPQTAA